MLAGRTRCVVDPRCVVEHACSWGSFAENLGGGVPEGCALVFGGVASTWEVGAHIECGVGSGRGNRRAG